MMSDEKCYLVPETRAYEQGLPFCVEVEKYLSSGKSAIFHMCQRSGQPMLYRHIQNHIAKNIGCDICILSLNEYVDVGALKYQEISGSVQRSARLTIAEEVHDRWGFRRWVLDLAASLTKPLAIVIGVSGPDFSEVAFELICDFHKAMSELPSARPLLSIIVVDDYSLYFYERWRTAQNSRWDIFFREFFTGFSKIEHRDFIYQRVADAANRLEWDPIIDELYLISGGHYGITLDLLSYVELRKWVAFPGDWNEQLKIEASKSDVVEFVKAALEENGRAIAARALEFREPRTIDASDIRIDQFIRRVGLLKAVGEFTFQLDEGLLGQLVARYSEEAELAVFSDGLGPTALVQLDSAPSVGADDFVIIHLSDIHFGDGFPFNVTESDEKEFPDRLNLVEAICADVAGLGFLERVDGVVISGDLTSVASMPEFLRARQFIDLLLGRLGVKNSALSIIGGNHDVQWFSDEPSASKAPGSSPVSKENLGVFMELLGCGANTDVRMTMIRSRSGKRELVLIAVDSNFVESREAGGIGFVSKESLVEASNMVCARVADLGPEVAATVWCVTHHHVFPILDAPVERARRGKVTTMASAATLLDGCSRMAAEVILHGHEHQPTITKATRWQTSSERTFRPISVIGAGSAGASTEKLGPFSRNHYYILICREESVIVLSRMLGDMKMGFTSHANIQA